jgi:hypothetical protein
MTEAVAQDSEVLVRFGANTGSYFGGPNLALIYVDVSAYWPASPGL